jgi:hypothetical protein
MSTERDSSASPNNTQRFVPRLLRELPRWCRWQLVTNRQGALTKKPDCSTSDPDAGKAFNDIDHATSDKGGIGFLTGQGATPRGYLVALDFDNCRDPKTGAISPWAQEVLKLCSNSFAEVSPSGFGLRQWVLLERLPPRATRSVIPVEANPVVGCRKHVELQFFGLKEGGGGYVTVTGNQIQGTSQEIIRIPSIDIIFRHFDVSMETGGGEALDELPIGNGVPPTLDEVDGLVRNQPNGDILADGDWQKTKAKSASDAFYELQQRTLIAANGHGEVALDYLLDRTAWGRGAIEDSKDPTKYEREDWVARDLMRTAGKIKLPSADVFDDGFDCDSFRGPENEKERTDDKRSRMVDRSPILTVGPPAPPWFDQLPPPREYLLTHPNGDGLLPRGKVGLFSAAGGTGKTTALVQLAVAVALGNKWLNHFKVGETAGRRVLLLLGEEDDDEVARKLYYTCSDMGLTHGQRATVERNVVPLALAGHALPLLRTGVNGNTEGTEHGDAVMRRLDDGDDWGLVVIDPVSRFTAVNVEGDNIIATRFIQELERFTNAPGKPTVLAVGHTSKAARKEGTADQRGVTGLFDAVRWAATLLAIDKKHVTFETAKNNLGPPSDPVSLLRGDHGLLTVEDAVQRVAWDQEQRDERDARELEKNALAESKRERRVKEAMDEMHELIKRRHGLSGTAIIDCLTGRRADLLAALSRLIVAGRVTQQQSGRRTLHFPARPSGLLD